MNTPKYQAQTVASFLKQRKIATLNEIGAAIGSASSRTVFRKLSELEYLSSYSHRGKFYTLKSIAQFTTQGLWSLRSVWFSHFGNLLQSAEALVHRSEKGYRASELSNALHVETKHTLTELVRRDRLQREPIGECYVYLSADHAIANQQRKRREAHANASDASLIVSNPNLAVDEAKATILLFCSMLNEKQRRLYAGLESLKFGPGGDAHIARIFDMDPHTVARGRRELADEGPLDGQRVRIMGGGRPLQEKKRLT